MFKLNRNRTAKSGERIDFNFCQLKALQVPKGWDKLFVSLVSVETGKTVTKSSKALVQNGTCQWTENIAESIRVPHRDSSKELEDCYYKLVLATGSARSGILGEATINITDYVRSTAESTVSVPLNRCNHGTTLQVSIHCLTPWTKLREDESKGTHLSTEDSNSKGHDEDIKSAGGSGSKSLGVGSDSNTSKELGPNSNPVELRSQETTISSLDSHHSLDLSVKHSLERKKFPGANGITGGATNINCQEDSTYSYNVEDASQSNNFSASAQTIDSENFHALSVRNTGSSKDILEVAENTIKMLGSDAKMWEGNSLKLTLDLDVLRKEVSDQSKKLVSLEVELSEANADRDRLRKEVDKMKGLAEKNTVEELQGSQDECARPVIKELEEEIRFQKETNSNLTLQLSRSQESNIELVSVLQEMEEALEKQKIEIEDLKLAQLKFNDMERSLVQKLADEKEKAVRQVKEEYEIKLAAQEEEVTSLRAKVSELTFLRKGEESSGRGNEECLVKEIELLKEKLEELERDCNELTEENLDLLFKLKDMSNGSLQGTAQSCELLSCEYSARSVSSSDHENSCAVSIREVEGSKVDLESKNRELGEELIEQKNERVKLEGRLRAREGEIGDLQAMALDLENEKVQLEEDLQEMERERDATFKCLSDLQNDLNILSSSFDSHVSANRVLERKCSELERRKRELEVRLIDLEIENKQFSVSLSGSEAELRRTREECDGLREETGPLRKLNEDLKKQNLKLKESCLRLELNLGKLTDALATKVEDLEENLSSIVEDASLKEKKLLSRLDSLHAQNRKREEEFIRAEQVFNQLYTDQLTKVENLQNEIEELRKKVVEAQNEREKISSSAADEIRKISAEKAELELSVEETRSLMEVKESEFEAMKSESENKVKGLIDDIAALREKLLKLVENRKSGEEKLKAKINELELTLTVSEYERRQLVGETTSLKAQLHKVEQLKNEISEAKSEKEKLEVDFKSTLMELEELKGERNACVERISSLEKVVGELEDCRQVKISLEEKLVCLESELAAKKAMYAEAMEERNDRSRVRRESRQFQQTVKTLEQERDKYLAKSRALEEELKTVKEERKKHKCSSGSRNQNMPKAINRSSPANEAVKHSKKNENPVSAKQQDAQRKLFPKSSQVLKVTKDPQSPSNASSLSDESFLVEAVQTDGTCKTPQNRLSSETVGSSRKSSPGGEMVTKEKFERTKSSLESELVELQERYSKMSLRYAEVEAQREELVMKLRAARNTKRWFS